MQRHIIPFAVVALVAAVAGAGVTRVLAEREAALVDSMEDLDMAATLAARALAAAPPGAMRNGEWRGLLPRRVFAHGRQVLVGDREGALIAAWPDDRAKGETLAGRLGDDRILTTFADKAGVMSVTLADGSQALATVRSLSPERGQVAVVHKVSGALADWRAESLSAGLALAIGGLALGLLAFGYSSQREGRRDAIDLMLSMRGRMDLALTHGRCGLWDWDIARGRIEWSRSMFDILGIEPETTIMSLADARALVHPDDGDLAELAAAVTGPVSRTVEREFRMRNAAGGWTWIRARGEIVRHRSGGSDKSEAHLVGIAVDITETRALAERSATADMRLRDAIETSSSAFSLWDADKRLVVSNSSFRRLYGLPRGAAAAGAAFDELMAAGSPPLEVECYTEQSIRGGRSGRRYIGRLANGGWLQINELSTADGGHVSVGTDITMLKQHEERLLDSERRLTATVADLQRSRHSLEARTAMLTELAARHEKEKAKAEAANRAKALFLANMSHEFRTPLNHILGFAEIMERETFGALGCGRYVEYCGDIRRGGIALQNMVSDVLDMSELDAGETPLRRARVETIELVDAALRREEDHARSRGVALAVEGLSTAPVYADREAVAKSLAHLLRNAIQFSPEGGRVRMRTRRRAHCVEIYVGDHGPGIPAVDLPRLGRPFEQAGARMANGMKGAGLGLAIARANIELHGGSLNIRSTVGRGTIVRVRLPAAPMAAAKEPAEIVAA